MLLSKEEYKEIVNEQKQLNPNLDTLTIMEVVQEQIEDTEMLDRISTLQENVYTDMVKDKGKELLGKAGEAARKVQGKQEEVGKTIGKGVSKAQENAGAWASSQKESAQTFMKENPQATVAIVTASAAGLAGIIQALRKKRQNKKIANKSTEKIDKQLKAAIKRRNQLMQKGAKIYSDKAKHQRKVGAQTLGAAAGGAQAVGSQIVKNQALQQGAQKLKDAKGAADVTREISRGVRDNLLKKFQELRPGEAPTSDAFKELQKSNDSFKKLLTQSDAHTDATKQQTEASKDVIKKYGEEAQEAFKDNMDKIGAGQLVVGGIAGLYALYKTLRKRKQRLAQQDKDTKAIDAKMKKVDAEIKKLKAQKKETGNKAIARQNEQKKREKQNKKQNKNLKPQKQ